MSRPFYSEFAWAYDQMIAGPVAVQCEFMQTMWQQRGVLPGSRILDAGCGTGEYAIELVRRGYCVSGCDRSADMIAEAKRKSEGLVLPLEVRDISQLPGAPAFDGILCRGVLNDILEGSDRQAVFVSFARALRQGGALILDVRDWDSTASRKTKEPVFEKTVETEKGRLTFRSVTQLDPTGRRLLVSERHLLQPQNGANTEASYHFVMQCWTKAELDDYLARAGYGTITYFGAYDCRVPIGTTDRIVAVASLCVQ
jgi:SAM-dependent methyltransferase